jgi:hypothetical protein
MKISRLISLGEGVMICDTSAIVTETTEVALGSLLLLDGDSHNFDLIVSETDLNLELVWHDELIGFN